MAKPTIDISSYRAKLDQDFSQGKISPREYRRLQTGMGNIAQGQNSGFSYEIDPGSRSFKAEKEGQQAKGKTGGMTAVNPLTGRKTSKAVAYIAKNQEENPPSALNEQTPSAPDQQVSAQQAPAEEKKDSSRYKMPGAENASGGNPVRINPSKLTPSLFQNPFQPANPNFALPPAVSQSRFAFGPSTNPPSPTPKGGGDGGNKPTAPTAPNKPVAQAPAAEPNQPTTPVKPVAPLQRDYVNAPNDFITQQIRDNYKIIGINDKRPSMVDGSGIYRNNLEELRKQYNQKYGVNYGGGFDWKSKRFVPGAAVRPVRMGEGGFLFGKNKESDVFTQSGREGSFDLDGALNTAMGVYALASGLSNKSPKVPQFQKLQGRIRPISGDYDTLQRNLNSADSNYGSMVRTLRNNAGSDKTTYIRGLLGANSFRNSARSQAYGMDSQIRIQDRQRFDYQTMAEDQYNNAGVNQNLKDKFSWDAQRWGNRATGSQQMLNSSLNFGVQKRANIYNNNIAQKNANAQVGMLEGTLRTQIYNEWIRNNGGIPPTQEQLDLEMKKVIPQKPTLFI